MPSARIISLPYHANPCEWFSRIKHLQQPALLDSCHDISMRGQFDIITASPAKQLLVTHQDILKENQPLAYYLSKASELLNALSPIENYKNLPFMGGLIGWINYEAAHLQHSIPQTEKSEHTLPVINLSLYLWAIINDHQAHQSYLIAHPDCDTDELKAIEQLLLTPTPTSAKSAFNLNSEWTSNLSRTAYADAFQKTHEYIRAGDCYQINLAQRFSATFDGDPWQAYLRLRETAAAHYSAFISTARGTVLSLSPETFLKFDGTQRVETKPIKGTAPRYPNKLEDQHSANSLLNSEKNQAENLMIVDLLRNDLGQCCIPGSIKVDELFTLESFATVHHLVSQISGQLQHNTTASDMIAAAFPGGSITGAPKKRAMEIIHELEPNERSIYCGSIGYLSCHGKSEFNIAIRTLLAEENTIHCWAGGGIVSDSDEEEEYQETFNKVNKLLLALKN